MNILKEKFFIEGELRSENNNGEVYVNRISEKLQSNDLKVYFVTFKNSARTRAHYHDSDQILIAHDDGGFVSFVKDLVQTPDGKWVVDTEGPIHLDKDETVMIPAGKLHIHGAREGIGNFSHTAILKNGKTIYF
jgi:hypothetical protein